MNNNTVHEIGNYLQQIISYAEHIENSDEDIFVYSKKIKTSAYKIDALITDATSKKEKLNTNDLKNIDLTQFIGLNILIVDDVIENIQIMENIFNTLSCNITSAMSGEEALKIFNDGFRPDIVCMDIMMPGMDGTSTTKELKSLGSKAYFIAVSALKNQLTDVVSIFDCWLPKPFTIEHLKGSLSRYKQFSNTIQEDTVYKLDDKIPDDIKKLILHLAQTGAYSELSRCISTLDESRSKEFLIKSLKKVDFNSIIKSIVSP